MIENVCNVINLRNFLLDITERIISLSEIRLTDLGGNYN